MKNNYLSKHTRCTYMPLLLLIAAMSLLSCVEQDLAGGVANGQGKPVTINLSLPGVTISRNNGTVTDETVSRIRVLAFDRNNKRRCKLNRFVASPNAPFWFELNTGTYDFHFVMNEPLSNGEETTGNQRLNAVSSYDDLAKFHVPTSNMISNEGLYVMSGSQTNVIVEANKTSPAPDGHYDAMVSYTDAMGAHNRINILNIIAVRLAAKVNLKLVKKVTPTITIPYNEITEVKITGMPAAVPVLAGVLSEQPAVSDVALTPATITTSPAGDTYEGFTAIIPSYLLARKEDKVYAANLSVLLQGKTSPSRMSLGHDIVADDVDGGTNGVDYNLYRNTVYHIFGKVDDGIYLKISVLPWDEYDTDTSVGYAATNIGKPGAGNIYYRDGDKFTTTIYWSDNYLAGTTARIRVDMPNDQQLLHTFAVPATDMNGKSVVYVVTPAPYLKTPYLSDPRIVMEVEVRGKWKIVAAGTVQTEKGGYAHMLYFGADGSLQCGFAGIDFEPSDLAYFKFGSLIGFSAEKNDEPWSASRVKFNPVTPGAGYADYASIPYYNATIPGIHPAIGVNGWIHNSWHLAWAGLLKGFGDPCRLVGLTAAQVKAMTSPEINNYKSGWRMPTDSEQKVFMRLASATINQNYVSKAYPCYGNSMGEFSTIAGTETAPGRGYFPATGSPSGRLFNPLAYYVPTTGYVLSSGITKDKGVFGGWWSDLVLRITPNDNVIYGASASFSHLGVMPSAATKFDIGRAVRCIRK